MVLSSPKVTLPLAVLIKGVLFLFSLSPLLFEAEAQTINAASCSASDVSTALNHVTADGTTVVIPSGNCTWTTGITYNQTFSTTIQGQSATSGTCAPGGTCTPTDNTIITDNVAGTALNIHTAAGKSLRITGITFNPSSGTPAYGAITLTGPSTSVRVDHNHFNDTVNGEHTIQVDQIQGVFDHNFFDSTNSSNLFFFQFQNLGTSTVGHESWAQSENFGTSQFIFVENNLFQNGTFMFDCFGGGRLVARYNIVGFNTRIQTHGTTSDIHRSCRTEEVYGNTFTFSSNPAASSFAMLVDYEGGNGLWWGNTITGYVNFLREDVVRSNSATYPEADTPKGWGYCASSPIGGVPGPSNWDGNISGHPGWPCLDGIGRGAGDLLSGTSVPSVVNTTTGTIAWPHQALVPVYAWANTFNTSNFAPNHYWENFDGVSVENRDYYLELPNFNEAASFNGTAGIGHGTADPATAFPTCTTGVGYWLSTTQTLYKCTSTNTWTSYYQPYTYPHPLQAGGGGGGVQSPQNLQLQVH